MKNINLIVMLEVKWGDQSQKKLQGQWRSVQKNPLIKVNQHTNIAFHRALFL